jgi:hypothetical protein
VNLSDHLADLYRFFHLNPVPPPAITTRLTGWINDTHREILSAPGAARLRDDVMAFTVPANVVRTGLPPMVVRINAITDRVNNHKLAQVPLSELRLVDPSQAFTGGYPLRYAVTGQQAVQQQPSEPTGLWVSSDLSSDITQTVQIQTLTDGGYSFGGSVVLSGKSRIQFLRTDHINVTKCFLDVVALGNVSLYDASAGGNELTRIERGRLFSRYLAVEWHPIPTLDVVEYIDFTRSIGQLFFDTDESLLPTDFHQVISTGAMTKECLFLNDPRYGAMMGEYQKGIRDLKSFILNDGDRIVSLRPIVRGWSQLGAQFPADRWF